MTIRFLSKLAVTALLAFCTVSAAADERYLEACLLEAVEQAPADSSVEAIRRQCDERKSQEVSVVEERLFDEQLLANNPFVITAHKPNYVLPVTFIENPNTAPYSGLQGELQHWEVKFQLSLKFQVASGVLGPGSRAFFAYTNQSYWQAYNKTFSSPFRETDHEPEAFVVIPQKWGVFGMQVRAVALGINHQSNGRPLPQSRSWNRLMGTLILERGPTVLSLKTWYRFPERKKRAPDDALGDDNPDILDYMGRGELRLLHKRGRNTLSLMLRNNLKKDNRGAVEMGWSFPLGRRLKGYLQYFDGYGESLIDYNARTRRIGLGIALTDWL